MSDPITVHITAEDFEHLSPTSMRWQGLGWHDQPARFRPYGGHRPIDWSGRLAYWFADAASMILARAYLDSIAAGYQVLIDEAEGEPGEPPLPFVIITDYATAVWHSPDEG